YNRKKKKPVLTNLGKTKTYEVEDGLDQRRTMSLILWRIYYDLLITKIDRNFEVSGAEKTIRRNLRNHIKFLQNDGNK
ncbi:15962_t:CDS:2, partial [Gigaspora rosea]